MKRNGQVGSPIRIEDDNIRTFYSNLYRTLLFPRNLSEVDANGNVYHYSPYNGEALSGYMFTDTGFWDTFRSLFPFLNFVYPSENVKMQEGLVNAYKESGFLPEWASPGHRNIMVGNNSASVVADAYMKGLRGYDIETLWEALKWSRDFTEGNSWHYSWSAFHDPQADQFDGRTRGVRQYARFRLRSGEREKPENQSATALIHHFFSGFYFHGNSPKSIG